MAKTDDIKAATDKVTKWQEMVMDVRKDVQRGNPGVINLVLNGSLKIVLDTIAEPCKPCKPAPKLKSKAFAVCKGKKIMKFFHKKKDAKAYVEARKSPDDYNITPLKA